MDKKSLRKKMKQLLAAFPSEKYRDASSHIQQKLFNSKEWEEAITVGITVSRAPEVDTAMIIETAWREGKKVAVPKCYPEDKRMSFYLIESFDQLETVYFGLKEPKPSATQLCEKEEIDLMFVPGLIFDKGGYRIGFGGGYYDRYLVAFHGKKLSLAFDEQIKDEIIHDTYDIPVHKIITDKGVYECYAGK